MIPKRRCEQKVAMILLRLCIMCTSVLLSNATTCPIGSYYTLSSCTADDDATSATCAPEPSCSLCPAGTYGSSVGLTISSCSGLCKEGYYCPPGSTTPTAILCGAGQYCPAGSGIPRQASSGYYVDGGVSATTNITEVVCPVGTYCVNGVKTLCPAGVFGNNQGATDPACSGTCAIGYYCPPGSTRADQEPCGSPLVYCPAGSGSPTLVTDGYCTIGGADDSTMHGQLIAPLGSFASGGILYACPGGYYGDTFGLSSSYCSGLCEEGFYCPEGSTSARAYACGGPNFFCPRGSRAPISVTLGYYTSTYNTKPLYMPQGTASDYTLKTDVVTGILWADDNFPGVEVCPPGMYRDWSVTNGIDFTSAVGYGLPLAPCVQCATGTYKASGGDDVSLCIACPTYTSASSTDRTTCVCHRVAGGNMDWVALRFDTTLGVCVGEQSANYAIPPAADSLIGTTYARYEQFLCEPGYYCQNGVRESCPPGTYGSLPQETSNVCEAPCPQGYYCPTSTSVPISCGDTNVICPTGSIAPVKISPGEYTVLQDPTSTTVSITSSTAYMCPLGYFCTGDGYRIPCPKGYYGDTQGLVSNQCSGQCLAGYICAEGSISSTQQVCGTAKVYCPMGSYEPTLALPGFYTVNAGIYEEYDAVHGGEATRTAQVRCSPGSYCVDGVSKLCPAGTFSWEYTTDSIDGCLECPEGFYCPEGTSAPLLNNCGATDVYCPPGSSYPITVEYGHYTLPPAPIDALGVAQNQLNQIGTSICEPGYWCSGGARFACPAGVYGNTKGLTTSRCTGPCPAGFSCPLGSSVPVLCPDRTFSTGGAAVCTQCVIGADLGNPDTEYRRCNTARWCCNY